MKTEKLTYERANELLRYDPDSGKLFWRVSRGTAKAGDEAGGVWLTAGHKVPYLRVRVEGVGYMAHQVVWLLFYGKPAGGDIDHRDGNGLNNRPENLRVGPQLINGKNKRMACNNTSGVTGVSWFAVAKKWRGGVKVNRKYNHIGLYANLADAEAAVREFRAKHGFTERHGGKK
ncbi:MAG: HNH endonuclease [Desulfobulbaceae bacterium]|nr:HNH endonuclease [Desulfobulbaceae bacterium]